MKKTYSRPARPLVLSQENLPEEYLNSCRLCLCQSESLNSIFNEDNILPTSTKIRFSVGLEISEDDGLPALMCEKCFNHIIDFYAFKKLCIATDAKLKQYMRTAKQNLVSHACNVNSSKGQCVSTENSSNGNDKKINLIDDATDFENDRVSCLLEEDNLHPDAPEDVIFQIKKEFEGDTVISASLFEDISSTSTLQKNNAINVRNDASNISVGDESVAESIFLYSSSSQKVNLECKECTFTFVHIEELLDHERKCHGNAHYQCSHCWKSFIDKSLIERHMRLHIGQRPFQCDICKKKFLQKETLSRHIKLHDEKSEYKCHVCPRVLLTIKGLKCHLMTHHTIREPHELQRYKCKFCVKAFCHSSGLSRHLLSHSGVYFMCEICCKTYSDASSLKRHKATMHPNSRQTFSISNFGKQCF